MLFSRFMALGDNIVAGYQNAALTEKHQKYSFVALMARQGATPDFKQPLLAYPGLGSESYGGYGTLELRYLDNPNTPHTINPDPVVYAVPFSDYPDFDPENMPYVSTDIMNYPFPYNNLGIPGIFVDDVYKAKSKLKSRSHSGLIDVVLRNAGNPYGEMSPFAQAKLFQPSLLVCWVGMYDVLGYAQFSGGGQSFSEPTSDEDFATYYAALMDSLKSTRAAVVAGNIPDILDMPYFNIVPHVVIDTVTNTPYLDANQQPIPLIGVHDGDKLLMPARLAMKRDGDGIPAGVLNGSGDPIPEDMVLDADEISMVENAIGNYNTIIDSVCSQRKIPVVDMYSFFKQLQSGIEVAGQTFTDSYLSGGFYSLDGIHPTDLGNALIANQWLEMVNSKFRVSIPGVDIPALMSELQPLMAGTISAQ